MPGKRRTTPELVKGILYWEEPFFDGIARYECKVESATWYTWLEGPGHTTFYYNNIVADFTARREKRRQKWVWYAFKYSMGNTGKRYLGPSHKLTLERLNAAADWFYHNF